MVELPSDIEPALNDLFARVRNQAGNPALVKELVNFAIAFDANGWAEACTTFPPVAVVRLS
jgi:hypothetical protein